MVSGVGDLSFTGLVFSWFSSTGGRKDQGLELQLTIFFTFFLTFTGLVFSWFSSTGRRKDQGLELQLNAVQNCGQGNVQAQV